MGGRMKKMSQRTLKRSGLALMAGASLSMAMPAVAAEINTGVPDLKIRWDNTLKYSAAARLRDPSSKLTANPNFDDGDRNFEKGLISNRGDWLSELDVTYGNFGGRVTAAAWYDDVYNRKTDADPGFSNARDVPFNQFPKETERLQGRDAEVLDAFVFGKFQAGAIGGTARAGRHSLVYGETLFMGANGIAVAQGPIDIIKALQVPNTQFKELGRPIAQVSTDVQLNSNWAVGGYYQFEWERNRVPASGSYFSLADIADDGGQTIGIGPGADLYRGEDIEGKDQGQFGLKLRYRSEALGTDFGLYGARFHDKNFQVYVHPGLNVAPAIGKFGEYQLVFPEAIKTYGISANTTLGEASVAAEFSWRKDTPFSAATGTVLVIPGTPADNRDNALYPIGDSAHLNMSMITMLPKGPLWESMLVLGEIGVNKRVSVKRNLAQLDPNTTRYAVGTRVMVAPSYFQVIPGVDIEVPIGIGYNPYGRSAVASFGPERGGDMSIGLKGTLNNVWVGTLQYTHYYGNAGVISDVVANQLNFDQVYKDRDFVSLSISRTF